ncbi:hypothetical protein [Nonlabens xiamenensis]|uniref:hypothetical protein n=1 Tax=Nonlabens xiamenensis TaxID=2341043 RepID=UPI000F60EBE4|nr:hypothetical protein [Nonlabens xiamenensis]|tara:strand:+ start:775 stop:1005 length:231 start_codon:yes stop_codon:yes gene_type:complete
MSIDNPDRPDLDLEEGDWYCSMNMGIDEVRLAYQHISFALETWPGSPARPPEEQEWLMIMKSRLFAMMTEYAFTEL